MACLPVKVSRSFGVAIKTGAKIRLLLLLLARVSARSLARLGADRKVGLFFSFLFFFFSKPREEGSRDKRE